MGSDRLKPPKDPKAALNSLSRPPELRLGSLEAVLISWPPRQISLTLIYPLPPHPDGEEKQHVPPLVPYRHLICVFSHPRLSRSLCLARKTNHPQPLSSETLQEMMQKCSSSLDFLEREETEKRNLNSAATAKTI